MIDSYTLQQCKANKHICKLKVRNLEHAVQQAKLMITESAMDPESLVSLRRKVAESILDLEVLYLLMEEEVQVNWSFNIHLF